MKKTIFTLSALTFALALTGCNDSDKSAQTEVQTQPEAEVTTQAPAAINETDGLAEVPAVVEQESTTVQEDVNTLPATAAGAAEDINTAADNAIESATDSLNDAKETLKDK